MSDSIASVKFYFSKVKAVGAGVSHQEVYLPMVKVTYAGKKRAALTECLSSETFTKQNTGECFAASTFFVIVTNGDTYHFFNAEAQEMVAVKVSGQLLQVGDDGLYFRQGSELVAYDGQGYLRGRRALTVDELSVLDGENG